MIKEFKKFIMRGSVVDMAVGIIIGSAFSTIVKSLVEDVLMPPIGLLLGKVDFSNLYFLLKEGQTPAPYLSLAEAAAAGAVTINIGLFVNSLITFLIVAFVVFLLIKGINRLHGDNGEEEKPAATTKKCPFCISEIPLDATRCPNCTSELPSG